jgi:hypothetical protein
VLERVRDSRHQGLGGLLRFGPSGERVDPAVGVYRYEGDRLVFLGTHDRLAAAGP